MSLEDEYSISKQNRRRVQDSEPDKMANHPFEIIIHTPDRKVRQRRKHDLERKAAKRK